jgi:MFS family permease
MAADLGATIGPLGGAWLYQVYGKGMPFYANGIILAICGLILAFWLKEPQSRIPDAQELI